MKVKFFATYRDITKCPQIEHPAEETVLALLHALAQIYGRALREKILSEDGYALGEDAIVLVNGRHIAHLQGVQTPLRDADSVAIFPLVAGG